jgi:hypothetical protein
MRVLTIWPDGEPAPFIAAAAQRIGNHATPQDIPAIASSGGMCR